MTLTIGFRGAKGYARENTLSSIEQALQRGADALYLDIRRSGEGTPILFRPSKIKGISTHKLSLRKIQSYHYVDGEHIPTLKEALDFSSYSVQYILHVRDKKTAYAVLKIIKIYVKKYGWPSDRFILLSSSLSVLRFIRRKNKQVYTAYYSTLPFTKFSLARKKRYDIDVLYVHHQFLNRSFVRRAHARGFGVFTGSTNFKNHIELFKSWDVDGIASDYPDIV